MFYEGHTSRPSNPTRAMYPPQASSQPGLRPVTRVTQRLSSPSRSIVTPQWGYQSNLTHAATVPQWGCTKWYQPAPSLEQRTTASSDILSSLSSSLKSLSSLFLYCCATWSTKWSPLWMEYLGSFYTKDLILRNQVQLPPLFPRPFVKSSSAPLLLLGKCFFLLL